MSSVDATAGGRQHDVEKANGAQVAPSGDGEKKRVAKGGEKGTEGPMDERYGEESPAPEEEQSLQQDDAERGPALRFLPELAVHGLLIFFSIWGVLCRLGLIALFTYNGTPVFPLLWAQVVGCALMGWFVAARKGIETACVESW